MFLAARYFQYIDPETFDQVADLCDATGKMLGALRLRTDQKIAPGNAAGRPRNPQIPKSLNPFPHDPQRAARRTR